MRTAVHERRRSGRPRIFAALGDDLPHSSVRADPSSRSASYRPASALNAIGCRIDARRPAPPRATVGLDHATPARLRAFRARARDGPGWCRTDGRTFEPETKKKKKPRRRGANQGPAHEPASVEQWGFVRRSPCGPRVRPGVILRERRAGSKRDPSVLAGSKLSMTVASRPRPAAWRQPFVASAPASRPARCRRLRRASRQPPRRSSSVRPSIEVRSVPGRATPTPRRRQLADRETRRFFVEDLGSSSPTVDAGGSRRTATVEGLYGS
jgi:hypothetical protein